MASGPDLANAGQIKTVLVPVAGSETDRAVLSLALRLAQPLHAHLEFLHLKVGLAEAAARLHLDFCQGAALHDALGQFERQQSNLATSATNFVRQFCHDHAIGDPVAPGSALEVMANCIEKTGPALETMLFHARHSDLIVLGRPQHTDGMPADLIDELLVNSGRPLLIAAQNPSPDLFGTVLIGWKETANAARAVTAALPILQLAKRVVVVNIAEADTSGVPALQQLGALLAWHGVTAEVRRVTHGVAPAAELLPKLAALLNAGLLVLGGFGHSRLRETVFGGVTRSLVDKAALPVLMAH